MTQVLGEKQPLDCRQHRKRQRSAPAGTAELQRRRPNQRERHSRLRRLRQQRAGAARTALLCPHRYALKHQVWPEKNSVRVKNYNSTPLPHAEGFWNNCPVIYNRCVYALQNVTDQQDELTALADERRVVVFNGQRWL